MRVLIAIDSYKGCLTSQEAGEAALAAFPKGEAANVVVSDGGEGFSTVVTRQLGGTFRTVSSHDPMGRYIITQYGIVENGNVAVIESSAASGLGLVSAEERNPLYASSFGTGEMIADALSEGVEEIWLGLGGTATCDGGTGLLQALGYRFLTPEGVLEDGHAVLGNIVEIDSTRRNERLHDCRIMGFYDVNVPLYGRGGAARMFAPQKGASPQMVEAIDSWMAQLGHVYSMFAGVEVNELPGAGAAGGIGGAIGACLRAEMQPGVWKVLDLSGFREMLPSCEVVITGEGHSDIQTLKGKVPYGVLEYVNEYSHVPDSGTVRQAKVYLVSGRISDRDELLSAGFDKLIEVTPDSMPLTEAMKPAVAKANITKAISKNILF